MFNNNIGHQAAVPAVAIGKTMYAYNAVLKPYSNLIGFKGFVFYPILRIIQQGFKYNSNLQFI
ncbi:hypothetical protein BH18ACT7_BH18ACT7_25700 [soil metagenome]